MTENSGAFKHSGCTNSSLYRNKVYIYTRACVCTGCYLLGSFWFSFVCCLFQFSLCSSCLTSPTVLIISWLLSVPSAAYPSRLGQLQALASRSREVVLKYSSKTILETPGIMRVKTLALSHGLCSSQASDSAINLRFPTHGAQERAKPKLVNLAWLAVDFAFTNKEGRGSSHVNFFFSDLFI